MILDLGTGDGAAVLRSARGDADALAVGVDTDAAAMREASRRAARKPARGGLPNAIFLAGTLVELPSLFDARVDVLRVTLPWGSLLRSAINAEPAFVADLLRVLRPGGRFELLVSVTGRDLAVGEDVLDQAGAEALASAHRACGFTGVFVAPATQADVDASGSTWAKRLGIPERRPAWLLGATKR